MIKITLLGAAILGLLTAATVVLPRDSASPVRQAARAPAGVSAPHIAPRIAVPVDDVPHAVAPSPAPAPARRDPVPEAWRSIPLSDPVPVPAVSTIVQAAGKPVTARTAPDLTAAPVATLPAKNDFRVNQDQTFLVLSERPGWYEVQVPVRPNGTTGWVPAAEVTKSTVTHYLVAKLREYRLEHYVDGARTSVYPVAIGKRRTPTATGLMYVWAKQTSPGGVYNPVIFALSGFSPVLENWPGGGRAGIHGWPDAGVVGRAASNGCLRMRRADAAALSAAIPLGTPVLVLG